MKVNEINEMWENQPVPVGKRHYERQRKRQALAHELWILIQRELTLYQQLLSNKQVVSPENVDMAHREDYIWIKTSNTFNIPASIVIWNLQENRNIEKTFNILSKRIEKVKSLLAHAASVVAKNSYK